MAESPMVRELNDPFLEAVKRAVQDLEDLHGPLFAAVIVHLPETASDDWVFLAGSKSLLRRRLDGIRAIVEVLNRRIPKDYSTRIRQVDVLRPDDPLYLQLSRAFRITPGADVTVTNCNAFGMEIEHAVVFAMNKANAPSESRRPVSNSRRRVRNAIRSKH